MYNREYRRQNVEYMIYNEEHIEYVKMEARKHTIQNIEARTYTAHSSQYRMTMYNDPSAWTPNSVISLASVTLRYKTRFEIVLFYFDKNNNLDMAKSE